MDQDPGENGSRVHEDAGAREERGSAHGLPGSHCPNIYECWEDREATFLIGGDQCTRRCDFCQIDTGKPEALDRDEPRRVGESVVTMDLNYATITGVARDDLEDGGAWLYAETVRQIHEQTSSREAYRTKVELLAPDFNAVPEQLAEVFSSRPEVFAHNVETVPASSSASARASATTARSRSSPRPATTVWSRSRT